MNYKNINNNDTNQETPSKHYRYLLHKNKDIIGPFIDNNFNKIENNYYVSDTFKQVETEKINVIFAGCSITVGCGIDRIQKTWSYKVYDLFKQKGTTAGYFNVGCSGASPIELLFNIFKYVAKYGYPNYIFILFPNFSRDWIKFNTSDEDEAFRHGKMITIFLFNMYSILEDMCKTNDIKLFATSWIDTIPGVTDIFTNGKLKWFEDSIHDDMKKSFDTYYQIDKQRFTKNVYSYIQENDSNMTLLGNDNAHPSEALHYAWFKEAEYQLGRS